MAWGAAAERHGHRDLLRSDPGDTGHHRSTSRQAESSPCSAPTAPARPPCCAPSAACWTRERGQVMFEGRDIARMAPDRVMRLGICHVPEGREVFPFLTVRENLMMGAYTRRDQRRGRQRSCALLRLFPAAARTLRPARRIAVRRRAADAGDQPGADGRPKLLLLDEPSLGLSPMLVKQIFGIIRRINREQGVAILLVEQNAHVALRAADYGYVLEVGRVVMRTTATVDAAGATSRNSTSARRKRAPRAPALEERSSGSENASDIPALVCRRAATHGARKPSCGASIAASGNPRPGRNSKPRACVGMGLKAIGCGPARSLRCSRRPGRNGCSSILARSGPAWHVLASTPRSAVGGPSAKRRLPGAVRRERGKARRRPGGGRRLPDARTDRDFRHEGSS